MRRPGRPMASVAATEARERFQFDSLSGPPPGRREDPVCGGPAFGPMGDDVGGALGERDGAHPAGLGSVLVEGLVSARGEHRALDAAGRVRGPGRCQPP